MSVSAPEGETGDDGERSEGAPSRASRWRPAKPFLRGNAIRIGGAGLKPALLLLLVLAAFVAGCGGDDGDEEARTTQTLPELTVPEPEADPPRAPETETQAQPSAPQPAEPEPEQPADGGTPAPEPAQPEAPADTPENDVPPPADSPAERFEDFCEENPGACG